MKLSEIKRLHETHLEKEDGSAMIDVRELKFLVQQAEKAELLQSQLNRFEYLASYEYSGQKHQTNKDRNLFQLGVLEGMENYNHKWKEATEREIKPLW